MSIPPLRDHVVIARCKVEQTTAAGIVLPGSKEKPETGKVFAVSPGKTTHSGGEASVIINEVAAGKNNFGYNPANGEFSDMIKFGIHDPTEG